MEDCKTKENVADVDTFLYSDKRSLIFEWNGGYATMGPEKGAYILRAATKAEIARYEKNKV